MLVADIPEDEGRQVAEAINAAGGVARFHALFLASPAARHVTGQVIVVDGGLLVGRH